MEATIKNLCNLKDNTVIDEKNKMLINEIRDVCHQMDCTNMWFEMEEDSDLIEACIHQMEVLNARYRYLIRKARNDNISFSPFLNSILEKSC